MNTQGTTWIKSSGRKVAAVVVGLAILGGAAGALVPDADETAASARNARIFSMHPTWS